MAERVARYQLVVRPEAAERMTAEELQLLERHSYVLVVSDLVAEGQALVIDQWAVAAGWRV